MLSTQQTDFFDTFGFIKFPGLLKADIGWITEEFERVFPMVRPGGVHDGSRRTMVVPFIDQREKLAALIDHPAIHGICASLLGDDFNYMGSDGNYYVGNTPWHPDGLSRKRRHLKIAFYLDPLDGANGALRVVPGSHRLDDRYGADVQEKVMQCEVRWGLSGAEVPAQVLDVVPGDILAFDHNTLHSSWYGSGFRRMFTLNLSQRFAEEDLEELKQYLAMHAHYGRPSYYGEAIVRTAGEGRHRHLEQVLSVNADFAARVGHLPVMNGG